jgi:hypothetical protein
MCFLVFEPKVVTPCILGRREYERIKSNICPFFDFLCQSFLTADAE